MADKPKHGILEYTVLRTSDSGGVFRRQTFTHSDGRQSQALEAYYGEFCATTARLEPPTNAFGLILGNSRENSCIRARFHVDFLPCLIEMLQETQRVLCETEPSLAGKSIKRKRGTGQGE